MIKKVSLRKLYSLGLGRRGSPLSVKCYVEKKGDYFKLMFYPNFLAKTLLVVLLPLFILLDGISNAKETIKDVYGYVSMSKGGRCMSYVTIFSKDDCDIYKYLTTLFN